jgi:hypothetical protein
MTCEVWLRKMKHQQVMRKKEENIYIDIKVEGNIFHF